MRKVLIIGLTALLGLSVFMVGRKIWEYSLVKEDVIYFNENRELDEKLDKINKDIEKIKEDKKEELERLEKWEKELKEIKESL